MYKLTIHRLDNGYLVNGKDVNIVIQDNDNDELMSNELLLWEVLTYFGGLGSKWDKERIVVNRKKGEGFRAKRL